MVVNTTTVTCDGCGASVNPGSQYGGIISRPPNGADKRRDFCSTCSGSKTLTQLCDLADARNP